MFSARFWFVYCFILVIFVFLSPAVDAAVLPSEIGTETPTPTPTPPPEKSLKIFDVVYPESPIYVGSDAYIAIAYKDYFYNSTNDNVIVTYQTDIELKFRRKDIDPLYINIIYDILTTDKDIGEHTVTFTIKDTQNPLRHDSLSISFTISLPPKHPPEIIFDNADTNISFPDLYRFEIGDISDINLNVIIYDPDHHGFDYSYQTDLSANQLIPEATPADSNIVNKFHIPITSDLIGKHSIHYIVVDGKDTSLIVEKTFTVQVTPRGDELLFSPGLYSNYNVIIRDYENTDQILFKLTVTTLDEQQYHLYGGADRSTYISTGKVLNPENVGFTTGFVATYGPVMSDSTYPNLVTVFYVNKYENYYWYTTIDKFRTFSAFPTGNTLPVEYNGGELRTCAGSFLGNGRNQIAIAQGVGGNQVVRLFEYLGSDRTGWKVVGQFFGLVSAAATNNASGGLTLAAGDLDNDGIDELIVGQTNSLTSQTQFHVIDVSPSGEIGQRHPFAGFTTEFRGNGGIEIAVADLNGDGTREIIVASKGNDKSHGDARDTAPLSVISIIEPIVVDHQITGFKRPEGGTFSVFDETTNPSGAMSITAGDLDGNTENGDELLIGTGAMVSVKGFDVQEIKSAPIPKYKLIKVQSDGEKVTGFTHLYHSEKGLTAYDADTWKSGNIFVGVLDID